MTTSDPSLRALRRCAAGHPDGLSTLFERHGAMVYRLCLNLLSHAAEAEDATQDVFLKVLDKAGQFHGNSQVATWIHRIAVNHCLNLLDKRRRQPLRLVQEDGPEAGPAPADGERLEDAEVVAQVRALIARLPEEGRLVFVLRELEGLSYKEIAATLELPLGTVMSRLARARARFRELAGPTARTLGLHPHDHD